MHDQIAEGPPSCLALLIPVAVFRADCDVAKDEVALSLGDEAKMPGHVFEARSRRGDGRWCARQRKEVGKPSEGVVQASERVGQASDGDVAGAGGGGGLLLVVAGRGGGVGGQE